jgi:hypothetical protein
MTHQQPKFRQLSVSQPRERDHLDALLLMEERLDEAGSQLLQGKCSLNTFERREIYSIRPFGMSIIIFWALMNILSPRSSYLPYLY